ncbi:hypothetical protein F4861DRAFT_498212 [Xylaria intraflava]|nr:hypothetical protein F4861DRAFT_498212 [Xylaria intraflava]
MEDPPSRHGTNGNMAKPEHEPIADRSLDTGTTTNTQQKRRASSPIPTEGASLKSPKRVRVDDEKSDNRQQPLPQDVRKLGTDRQEIARLEEKKRGRRLLGGLMNTLSQANAGSQHKKRQDIERRQQAKSTQQRAEEDRLRAQRLSTLEDVRKVEQLKFDEEVMKTKHADMLAKAHYLQTRASPKIFYLPWKLTRTQEEVIKDQIQQVETIIKKEVSEVSESKERKARRLHNPGIAAKSSVLAEKPLLLERHETVGKPKNEPPADKSQPESTNSPPSRAANKVGPEKESDRVDDVMIEEDEDIVIY